YIPQTLADDGDPVDVLVITPVPLISGVVVTCRPIGLMRMQDEAGGDNKLLAVPIDKILSLYTQWQKPDDLNPLRLRTIQHFSSTTRISKKANGSKCWTGRAPMRRATRCAPACRPGARASAVERRVVRAHRSVFRRAARAAFQVAAYTASKGWPVGGKQEL